ncbi:MAG: hypothetical protein V1729_02195 [Candidatus Woesearchaeota archaeon]
MMRIFRKDRRKAQSALEYIHTYGWVIITVMILGGVLMYYNVSNTRIFLPMECSFLAGIRCMDANVEETLVSLVVLNEFGFALSNISVNLTGTCNSEANTTDGNIYGNLNVMLTNQQATYVFDCQNLSNMEISELVNIDYVNVETGESHIKVGKLEFSPTGT